MKKTKVIIPALGILLLSTAASVTGTVAWFSANATVTADGMNIKGKAESGIAIAAYKSSNSVAPSVSDFSDSATSTAPAGEDIVPTWSNDGTNWYHAESTDTNNGQAISQKGYALIGSDFNKYYQLSTFQIKSTGDVAQDVYVKSISFVNDNSNGAYDESLRVMVRTNHVPASGTPGEEGYVAESATIKIFAPKRDNLPTAETLNDEASDTDVITASNKPSCSFVAVGSSAVILPALTSTPLDVEVFVYYDGEDKSCTSDLIPGTWKALSLTMEFGSSVVSTNP